MTPTYAQIMNEVRQLYGYSVKCCQISEVKRKYGLTRGHAWNWGQGKRQPPCPTHKVKAIEEILKRHGMISAC